MPNERKNGYPLFVALALICSVAFVWLGVYVLGVVNAEEAAQAVVGESSATHVRVAKIERHIPVVRAAFHGFLVPFEELAVAAKVPGEIVEQWVEVSDDVTAGQPLFKVDDAVRRVEHKQALAVLDRGIAGCTRAKAQWDRIQELQGQQSSPIERTEAEMKWLSAKAVKHEAEAAVRRAALLLERTTVTSPIDGVVSRVYSRRGESTRQGQPLANVIEIDRLKLLAELEDCDIVWVKVGQPAVLTTKTFPLERFHGKVHRVFPRAVQTSRKFEVEIELPNPGRRLRPGFFMTGTIDKPPPDEADAESASVLVIPREAVVELYGRQFCWVVRADGARVDGAKEGSSDTRFLASRTSVVALVDRSNPRILRLVEGAAEGDLVVTKGLQQLSEQTYVRITD